MGQKFIYETNYFSMPVTWIARLAQFLIGMLFLFLVDLHDQEAGLVIGVVFGTFLAIGFLVWPTDELAVDSQNIYFMKRSILPFLDRTIVYKISEIKGIGSYSRASQAGLAALFIPIISAHRVELIFNDDSSKSHDLFVRKDDLKAILSIVRKSIS
jgi:hypothetical protein